MNVKLSIIVPIYGVEQYLRKCVDSLLAQDIPSTEYEIILVDDGSPDECPQICDENATKHANIRVIHQMNAGLSAARNAGLKAANGEYVCFLDSDDYWLPNKLGALMRQIEHEQLDVLRFDHQNVRLSADDRYEVFQPNKSPHYVDRRHDVVDGETYLDERMGYACYACQFVIRRSILVDSREPIADRKDCLFTVGIHFEDTEWLPRMMQNAKRVNSTEEVVYSYLHRPGSITQTQGDKEKIKKNVEDEMYVLERYAGMQKQRPDSKWLRRMSSLMASNVLTEVAISLYQERKVYIQRLRKLRVLPLEMTNQGKTYIRRAYMINVFGMNIYCLFMHLINCK